MQNNFAQNEPLKIKLNKQTSDKIQKLIESEVDDTTQGISLQTFMTDKKVLQPLPKEQFFPWLTEELRKLKAEDDFSRK